MICPHCGNDINSQIAQPNVAAVAGAAPAGGIVMLLNFAANGANPAILPTATFNNVAGCAVQPMPTFIKL